MTTPPGAQERVLSTGHRLARQYGETFYDEDALAKDIDQAIAQAVQAALDRIDTAFKAATDERFAFLREHEAEAWRWQAEGDMYGWNFHQGMAAGANWCDLMYQRVRRESEALRARPAEPAGPAKPESPLTMETSEGWKGSDG